jgi:hypothetical protein
MPNLTGTNANESLAGTCADQQLNAGAGADTLTGGGGNLVGPTDAKGDCGRCYTHLHRYYRHCAGWRHGE